MNKEKTKTLTELFELMQYDVDVSGHLADAYLESLKEILLQTMKKPKIELKNQTYKCGDGCCQEFMENVYVDGQFQFNAADITSAEAIILIAKALGVEIEFNETNEY